MSEPLTIKQAKRDLDENQTLELDLPSQPGYVAAIYHVRKQGEKYVCSVLYKGLSMYVPLAESVDWADFFRHLPPILQSSAEWEVL